MSDNENKTIKEILDDLTWWTKLRVRIWMRCSIIWYSITTENFRQKLRINKQRFILWFFGFKVIELCDYAGEDTFIFETKEEADKAFKFIEEKHKWLIGWWYGKDEFKEFRLEDKIMYYEVIWKRYEK